MDLTTTSSRNTSYRSGTMIREMIAEIIDTTPDKIKPEYYMMKDLHMDSLEIMDLLMRLDDVHGHPISKDFDCKMTVGELEDAYYGR
jgi:acyl carrier protein